MPFRAPALPRLLVVPAITVALLAGCGSEGDQTTTPPPLNSSDTSSGSPVPSEPAQPDAPTGPVPTLVDRPAGKPRFEIVRLLEGERARLFAQPGGAVVAQVGPKTEFDSPVAYAIVRVEGRWLAVVAPERRNDEISWLRYDPARMERYWTRYSLRVDISDRRLELIYGKQVVSTVPVTVGAAGTDTPEGRFAVTDALNFDDSPYYGCCALAISASQENLPEGWLNGDRVAIHGTPGPVGDAASTGCIRATNATMLDLFERVPLGTPVFVNA